MKRQPEVYASAPDAGDGLLPEFDVLSKHVAGGAKV
jgi:hypothetical protein